MVFADQYLTAHPEQSTGCLFLASIWASSRLLRAAYELVACCSLHGRGMGEFVTDALEWLDLTTARQPNAAYRVNMRPRRKMPASAGDPPPVGGYTTAHPNGADRRRD